MNDQVDGDTRDRIYREVQEVVFREASAGDLSDYGANSRRAAAEQVTAAEAALAAAVAVMEAAEVAACAVNAPDDSPLVEACWQAYQGRREARARLEVALKIHSHWVV